MAGGIRDGLDCGNLRDKFKALAYPGLVVTYLILFTFLNFSNLPFVIEYKTVKELIKKASDKIHTSSSNENNKV